MPKVLKCFLNEVFPMFRHNVSVGKACENCTSRISSVFAAQTTRVIDSII